MIDPKLIQVLRCPQTGGTLQPASQELIDRVNLAIEAGNLRDRQDQKIAGPIEGGLVTADGRWLYPVRGRIPVMIADESIGLGQLDA